MKIFLFASLLLVLASCAKNNATPESSSKNAEPNNSLLAFEEVCINTAPSFSGAEIAAAKYGITEINGYDSAKYGMSKDNSIGVQIKSDKECVITTPSQKDSKLTKDFLRLVGNVTGTSPSKVPTVAKINGAQFIFLHDRKGGEAFVMLRTVK